MRIEIVRLENIRSHVKSTVAFARGFNCMVGGLGCGKSSILLAIDFAFFGEPLGRSYEYLLREGATAGKVTVQFILNGKTYTLMRGLKKRGKNINQDMEQLKLLEEEKLLASTKNEAVEEQLKALTGLEKEIFREIIWIRQEHLKELLDVRPRERQIRLDQLFGLADYEVAWNNVAGIQRDFETERKTSEKDFDVVGFSRLQEEYNKTVIEFSNIEHELQGLREKIAVAEQKLRETTNRLQGLEALSKQTEELRKKETELRSSVAGLESVCARLQDEKERKKSAIDGLQQRFEMMVEQRDVFFVQLQEAGLKSDSLGVEEVMDYLASLDSQLSQIHTEQESSRKEFQTTLQRISNLATENMCPLCLQNLLDEYKDDLLGRLKAENAEREKRLAELQRSSELLQRVRGKINIVVVALQPLLPRLEDLKKRIAEEEEALTKVSGEYEQRQQQLAEFKAKLEQVKGEIEKFDVTQLEEARAAEREASDNYRDLKRHLEVGEQEKRRVSERLDEFKLRLDHAEQKMARMEKIGKLLEILDGVRNAYRSIQPRLRGEFVRVLERVVQQVLDDLVGEGSLLSVVIDETYTPYVQSEDGFERDVSNLSGGERTLLAFAYRLGLGQLIMQSKTGHGLQMLMLDEPTESLGREDGSVDRLAEAIGRLRVIEQIIAVTHSEAFAEKAEHVIRLTKENGESRVIVEK
ncbi:MAG TPA: SMC family ATPase [Candidatus Krumholzibacteriaceae bacterium]|nr:SMC family ATPase [Candidatus Krumholzibacteriaceae bacterium]